METYIQTLVGTPYVWWHSGTTLGDCAPFWTSNTPPPFSPKGANCAGFVNLVCRHLGVLIPGVTEGDPWAGGTWHWFRHSYAYSVLPGASHKPGTILLRDYADAEKDQGHIGVVLEGDRLAHCIPEQGVIIEKIPLDNPWWTHASDYLATRL
jgi:cell wall-associated NlpC family hydrolase